MTFLFALVALILALVEIIRAPKALLPYAVALIALALSYAGIRALLNS